MTLLEFVTKSRRTFKKLENEKANRFHINSGILSEFGEIMDILKANVAYNKEIDINHLKEEIGDYFFYLGMSIDYEDYSQEENDNIFKMWFEYMASITDEMLEKPFYETLDLDNAGTMEIVLFIVRYFNLDLSEILDLNVEKLKARYKDGFTEEEALNRDLDVESQILNK
jgi:NTP pyrophosphatase (non-canonical NTP hydrolase)